MQTACFLSPHLDDAVFSAGGTMAVLHDAGWRVVLATIFTATVPAPTGFALRCQVDKGLSADADYMALRRAEDAVAANALGLPTGDVHWLGLPEAPHRGYDSPAELFNGIRADDHATTGRVSRAIDDLVIKSDVLFTAAGIGNHVDHLHVLAATRAAAATFHKPLLCWQDAPYVLKLPQRPPASLACDVTAVLRRKLDACCAYTTQIGFQFGGEDALRRRLTDRIELFDGPLPDGLSTLLSVRNQRNLSTII